jgi:hypothetical protein
MERKKARRNKMILAPECWFKDESLPVTFPTVFIFQLKRIARGKKNTIIDRQSALFTFYVRGSFYYYLTIKIIALHAAIDKELVSIWQFLGLAGKGKQQADYY